MNYRQTLDFLYHQLPMFHRIGAAAYKQDLTTTIEMSRILGNPERSFPSVHIAGTNGKGSVAHFLASVLQEGGYKTGLFTSPHLKDYRERIRVSGKVISKEFVTNFVERHEKSFSVLKPSFFEYTYAMAMEYFHSERVDIAVVETGMGGRLDSTNLVQPVLTVITNISFDHTQFLGDTLQMIAIEKAGIIKPGVPVIIGETQEEVMDVFIQKAKENRSSVHFADQEWNIRKIEQIDHQITNTLYDISAVNGETHLEISCPLAGYYQRLNIVTVMQSISELRYPGFDISNEAVIKGISNVIINTGIMGRWQILGHSPLTICDTCHNLDGIRMATTQLEKTGFSNLHFVLGMVIDKDIDAVLPILPSDASYYFCKPDIPRGLDPMVLRTKGHQYGLTGSIYGSVREALQHAWSAAGKNDLVFIGGSIFVVAEVI
jgi:dihydrofolate synthase / folylpolyglutamate synthase